MNIKVNIDKNEADKRIKEIAKNQKNFNEVDQMTIKRQKVI